MKSLIASFLAISSICFAEPKMLPKPDKSHIPPYSDVAQSIVVGATYQHYKGPLYVVLSVARNSETLEEVVVYQGLYGQHNIWVRPLDMFLENVLVEGKWQQRFRLIQND